MGRSFLLISLRQEKEAIEAEYQDFLENARLEPAELRLRVIDDITKTVGSLEGIDGVFVGGSPLNITNETYDDYQNHVHAQMAQLMDDPTPTLMLCFGSTLVAHLDGGVVDTSYSEKAGSTVVRLTDAAATDPLMKGLPGEFLALTGHKENVATPGRNAVVLATGPTCPVQMVRANESTWAPQFHADMNPEGLARRMNFYRDHGYFAEDEYDAIVDSVRPLDTSASNKIMTNFVDYCLSH